MTNGHETGIIQDAAEKRISVAVAAERLGVSKRTVWRKIARYRERGAEGLLHGLTGKRSNRAKPAHIRERVVDLYRQVHSEMPISAFVRAIAQGERIALSRETVRKWLIEAGIWQGERA